VQEPEQGLVQQEPEQGLEQGLVQEPEQGLVQQEPEQGLVQQVPEQGLVQQAPEQGLVLAMELGPCPAQDFSRAHADGQAVRPFPSDQHRSAQGARCSSK